MWRGLKGRLPEALFEGFLIVFAVLVALGVDEYWEGREERELAAVALERIAAEIRDNRAELQQGRASNLALLEDLGHALAAFEAGEELALTSVNYEVALLGTDAWETARVTRAVHFVDFDRVTRISKVYRIQQLHAARQDQIVNEIAGIGGRERELPDVFGALRGALAISLRMECDLVAEYDSLLVELPGEGTRRPSGDVPLEGCDGEASAS